MVIQDWENTWATYDEATYRQVLEWIEPADVVLDIGAGDLWLARRMAAVAWQVIAIEQNAGLLSNIAPLPANLSVLMGDARRLDFPAQTTVAVLLMRHCRHFSLYFDKLCATNCARLLTNARWGVGVEQIDLRMARLPFMAITFGWYACRCGAVGFVPGPPESLMPYHIKTHFELSDCPACRPQPALGLAP